MIRKNKQIESLIDKPSVGVEEVIEVLADCKSKWIEDKAQALLKEFSITRRTK